MSANNNCCCQLLVHVWSLPHSSCGFATHFRGFVTRLFMRQQNRQPHRLHCTSKENFYVSHGTKGLTNKLLLKQLILKEIVSESVFIEIAQVDLKINCGWWNSSIFVSKIYWSIIFIPTCRDFKIATLVPFSDQKACILQITYLPNYKRNLC